MNFDLLQNSAAATGTSFLIPRAGTYVWKTSGTFGGAKVALQYLASDGVTWTEVTFATGAEEQIVILDEDTYVRCVVTSGTSPSISANLRAL